MSLMDDIRVAATRALGSTREWALGSGEDVSARDMQKALIQRGIVQPTTDKPRAMFHDPYAITDWGGWRQRPSSLTYDTLRQMTISCTPIAAIIQLRVNQLSQFARPQQGQYDRGYRVMLRDRRDRHRSMSPEEQQRATEIERMIETTGWLLPGERPTDRDSFRTYLKKILRDTLTYDQACTEILRDRRGLPSRFICLPSETIRPAVSDVEHMDPEMRRSRVAYVQIYENTVISEFPQDALAWCVMNPRSDLRVNGFGFSPVEQIIRLVTSWLFGFDYNSRFFTQGSAVKGLINIKGAIPDKQMRAFRRMWYSMVSGTSNAWRTPILNSDDIQWVSMHSNNREMEFAAWMDWLTKLICAVYGVDPMEINFQFGNTGQKSSLSSGSSEEKLTESKDKGLRPLVEFISDSLNQHIVWDLEPDFEFVFAGIDKDAEEKEREGRIKDAGALKMVDEVRAEMDMEPLPNGLGQVILSPVWLQYFQGQQALAQQAAGVPPPGAEMPPAPGGDTGMLGDDEDDEDDDLLSAPDKGDDDDKSLEGDDDDLLAHSDLKRAVFVQKVDRLVKSVKRAGRQSIEIELGE